MEKGKFFQRNRFLAFYLVSCIVIVALAIAVICSVKSPAYLALRNTFLCVAIAYCVAVLVLNIIKENKDRKEKAAQNAEQPKVESKKAAKK